MVCNIHDNDQSWQICVRLSMTIGQRTHFRIFFIIVTSCLLQTFAISTTGPQTWSSKYFNNVTTYILTGSAILTVYNTVHNKLNQS